MLFCGQGQKNAGQEPDQPGSGPAQGTGGSKRYSGRKRAGPLSSRRGSRAPGIPRRGGGVFSRFPALPAQEETGVLGEGVQVARRIEWPVAS